jgi:hypothetical protein
VTFRPNRFYRRLHGTRRDHNRPVSRLGGIEPRAARTPSLSLTIVCLLTIFAVCGIALTPNEALSRISGFLAGGGGGTGPSTPSVASIVPSVPAGTYTSGSISFAVNFTAPISSSGTITLPLNTTPTTGVASCANGTNVLTLTCTWAIGTNQSANPLATTSAGLSGGSIVATTGGAPANLVGSQSYTFAGIIVNPTGTPSVVTGVTITPSTGLLTQSGSIGAGNTAIVTVTFSTPESVNSIAPNVPTITLGNQGTPTVCSYSSGSTTTHISFACTFTSGTDTPIAAANTYLTTATSGAIQLNGGSISNGGVPATLTNANGKTFPGVSVDTTTPYFVTTGGSGSTCGWASPCTIAGAQTKAQSALKHIYVLGGTYNTAANCTFPGNVNFAGTTVSASYCFSTSDNGEAWLRYPGATTILDGGSSSYGTGVSVAFGVGGGVGGGSSNGIANFTVNGIVFQHYGLSAIDTLNPNGLYIWNTTEQNIYTSGPSDAACMQNRGWFSNVVYSHNLCQNIQGFGAVNTADVTTLSGYNLNLTFDSNVVLTFCSGISNGDCGGLYPTWDPQGVQSSQTNCCSITNNIVWNNQGGPAPVGIYLDDFASNQSVTGNLIGGNLHWSYQVHNGINNKFSNNVVDISYLSGTQTSPGNNNTWVYFTSSGTPCCGNPTNAAGNTLIGNIIYNGNTSFAPPPYMALFDTSPNVMNSPTDTGNEYCTVFGSFNNTGSQNGKVVDSAPIIACPTFANPSLMNGAGYQTTGTVPSGWVQLSTNQGPH